jgi:hypothetical protein
MGWIKLFLWNLFVFFLPIHEASRSPSAPLVPTPKPPLFVEGRRRQGFLPLIPPSSISSPAGVLSVQVCVLSRGAGRAFLSRPRLSSPSSARRCQLRRLLYHCAPLRRLPIRQREESRWVFLGQILIFFLQILGGELYHACCRLKFGLCLAEGRGSDLEIYILIGSFWSSDWKLLIV